MRNLFSGERTPMLALQEPQINHESQPITFVHLARQAGVLTVTTQKNEEIEKYCSIEKAQKRANIMALPTNVSGLDLDRIDDFRRDMGMPARDVLFFDTEIFEHVREIADEEANKDVNGTFFSVLDLVTVARNKLLESLNGPEIAESFAVHEIAHSWNLGTPLRSIQTTSGRRFRKPRISACVNATRSGFMLLTSLGSDNSYGYMLEEGYAEYERGLFVQKHGLVDAFTKDQEDYQQAANSGIPMHYWFKQQDISGEPYLTFPPGAVSATLLEMLCDHDAELLPILRGARQSVAGMRAFAQRVNGIMPGLYTKMQHAQDQYAAASLMPIIKRHLDV